MKKTCLSQARSHPELPGGDLHGAVDVRQHLGRHVQGRVALAALLLLLVAPAPDVVSRTRRAVAAGDHRARETIQVDALLKM